MKKNVLIYALVLLIALTAMVATAQGRRGNTPAPNQPATCMANCQAALGLSQDQVAEMTRIRTAFAADTAGLQSDLQAKMKEMAALWAVQDPNLDAIKQKAREADQIRAEIRDRAIDARGAILKVLTPTQRATCIKRCQSGQCACGMCGGCMGMGMGMGPGMCGMGAGNGAASCPMGTGMGKGRGGAGIGKGCGACGSCPLRQ